MWFPFSSLNSLLTPFTAYFWERIDLLSGFLPACGGVRSEKKRNYHSLDSGEAGLSGERVESLTIFAFTRPRSRLHTGDSDDLTVRQVLIERKNLLGISSCPKDTSMCRFSGPWIETTIFHLSSEHWAVAVVTLLTLLTLHFVNEKTIVSFFFPDQAKESLLCLPENPHISHTRLPYNSTYISTYLTLGGAQGLDLGPGTVLCDGSPKDMSIRKGMAVHVTNTETSWCHVSGCHVSGVSQISSWLNQKVQIGLRLTGVGSIKPAS